MMAPSNLPFLPPEAICSVDDAHRLAALERTARLAVEEELRRRDELLATVSHDLQNPLAAIQARAQLLRRGLNRGEPIDAERLRAALSSIESIVQSMTAQIQELLDATRVQAGQPLVLQRTTTDVVSLAQAVIATYADSSESHDIQFEPTVPALLGLFDAPRLRRVLSNLVSNALKYSPKGGEVRVRLAREESPSACVVITVQDHGVGIPAQDLPHIFQPFHRARNADGSFNGMGLGLASVRRIVELHGGSVSVESREGFGSTFTVRLPLIAQAQPSVHCPGPASEAGMRVG